jgi:N-acetylmuramoyl-L-alanine amidase
MKRGILIVNILCSLLSTCQPNHNSMVGLTTGPLPFLKYGLGDDRLGGAKLTFLDTNILVRVVDSVKDDYKVQLSQNHFAYLAKASFRRADSLELRPYYLTEKWRVFGDDKYDYITVQLDERLPYRSYQEVNPSRIIVDVFGATSNTNWITQLSTAKEIKNAYYENPEDDVFRIIIDLNHPQHWGYSIYYEEKKLVIRIKRQPDLPMLGTLKVAIDAGHGGDNVGAEGETSHIAEKKLTLLFARELEKALLAENATVFMTREKDTTLSMVERIMMLREQNPDFLISLHLNSDNEDTVQGVSTYYRYIGFRPLTMFILKRMEELGLKEYGNVGSFNFSLNGPTDYPNCLVEIAFLSNKEDERKILNPEFHKQVAEKIVAGIKDWLASLQR